MRFSLRTLIIFCTVTGILVGLAVREYQLSIPGSFPVTYSTPQRVEEDAPDKVLMWRKRSVRRATIAAEKAYDWKMRQRNPTDADVLEKVLNAPADIPFFSDQQRKVIIANRNLVLQKAPQWLSEKTDHETLIGAAHVLAVLDDRRAFDLAIKRLPQIIKDPRGSELVQRLACTYPTDWAIASPEIMNAARDVFYKIPNHQLAWVLEKSGDKAAALHYHRIEAKSESVYGRTTSLKWLTENAPSEEVFQQVKQQFSTPEILTDHDAPKLLALYLESENPRWRSDAFDLAMQLINTPPGKRGGYHVYPYERIIFAHGGDEYGDYFKRHVEQQNCRYAMRGLGRLLPRQEYLSMLRKKNFLAIYLEEEGDAAIPFLRKKNAIYMLAKHQAGTKDPTTAAAIRSRLTPGTNFFTGLHLIDALETLGVDVDRDKLMDGLKPPQYDRTDPHATGTHWSVNRISNDDFLKFASQYAAKFRSTPQTPLTAKQVFDDLDFPDDERGVNRANACQLMAAAGIAKEFVVDDYGFEDLGLLARNMTELFVVDMPFESVSLESSHLRFAAKNCVYEVDVFENGSWYDPVTISDVLNSILDEHSKSPKRLYCFDMALDWRNVTIAYLDESFVDELGETYAIYPEATERIRQKPAKTPGK